jgi:hypothetical protein
VVFGTPERKAVLTVKTTFLINRVILDGGVFSRQIDIRAVADLCS